MRPPILFLLILLMFSCEYEPGGTVFTEVESAITNDISIEIPLNTKDTIFLFQPAQISYRSILGGHEVKHIRVSLDGESLFTSGNATGSFGFHTPNFPSGFHRLTIELYATGGSGSLADVEGKEEIIVQREYTLSIDREAPGPVPISNIILENGFVKVSWAQYTRKNFQRYYLQKYCYNTFAEKYEPCWYKRLGNQFVTTLTDSSFVGGKVKYRIAAYGADQVGPYSEKEFEVASDPQISWEWLNNDELKLTWRKPACYSSFTSYVIDYGPYDRRETITVDKLLDTTLIIKPNLKFAAYLDVFLRVNPYRINTYSMDYVSSRTAAFLGTKFPTFFNGRVQFNQGLNRYFIVRPINGVYNLIRVNPDDNYEEQRVEIRTRNVSISRNGAHLLIANGNTLTRIDPLTLTAMETFDLATLEAAYAEWTFNVSDNNILSATNYGGTYIVDLSDFHVIQELPFDFSTIISPDGNYLIRRNEILALENGQYVSKMSILDNSHSGRQFISNNRLLLPAGGTLLVIDLNSFSVINRILVEGAYQGYDPVSGLASSVSTQFDAGPRRMFLHSLDMKEAIKTIEIAGSVTLMNNALVADGLITPLSSYYP